MYHAQPRLTDITFVAFDTETTGLFPMMHRLVEIRALRFRLDGRELAIFQMLISPEVPIPLDVQQVHGITDRMVRGQPTIQQILPSFIAFFGNSDRRWHRPQPRKITPRLVLEVQGVAYVIAHGHLSDAERTFRVDRIRECWLPE